MLIDALGLPVTPQAIERISPLAVSRSACRPISQRSARSRAHRRRGGVGVLPERRRRTRRDVLLIEGVGGIMVPLDDQRTILDVMMALQLPLILVTGSYLGTSATR